VFIENFVISNNIFIGINIKKSIQLTIIFNKTPQSDWHNGLIDQTTILYIFIKKKILLCIILPKIPIFS